MDNEIKPLTPEEAKHLLKEGEGVRKEFVARMESMRRGSSDDDRIRSLERQIQELKDFVLDLQEQINVMRTLMDGEH